MAAELTWTAIPTFTMNPAATQVRATTQAPRTRFSTTGFRGLVRVGATTGAHRAATLGVMTPQLPSDLSPSLRSTIVSAVGGAAWATVHDEPELRGPTSSRRDPYAEPCPGLLAWERAGVTCIVSWEPVRALRGMPVCRWHTWVGIPDDHPWAGHTPSHPMLPPGDWTWGAPPRYVGAKTGRSDLVGGRHWMRLVGGTYETHVALARHLQSLARTTHPSCLASDDLLPLLQSSQPRIREYATTRLAPRVGGTGCPSLTAYPPVIRGWRVRCGREFTELVQDARGDLYLRSPDSLASRTAAASWDWPAVESVSRRGLADRPLGAGVRLRVLEPPYLSARRPYRWQHVVATLQARL